MRTDIVNSPFTRQTLAFLRALKRHDTREWFLPLVRLPSAPLQDRGSRR